MKVAHIEYLATKHDIGHEEQGQKEEKGYGARTIRPCWGFCGIHVAEKLSWCSIIVLDKQ